MLAEKETQCEWERKRGPLAPPSNGPLAPPSNGEPWAAPFKNPKGLSILIEMSLWMELAREVFRGT